MAFFLLFVSVLVSIKHQQYADNSATNGGNQSIPVSSENAPATKDESQKSKESLHPWWAQAYVLIGWPNGITVWALLLTMAVIAVQTMETRKATESAGKQLAFQQEVLRPRLKITNFTRNTFNEAMAGEWVFVNMEISDSGGFPAYGVIADTWIEFVYGVPPYRFSPMAKYNRADFFPERSCRDSIWILHPAPSETHRRRKTEYGRSYGSDMLPCQVDLSGIWR